MKISLQAFLNKINKWIHNLDHPTPLEEMPKPKEHESQDEIVGEWENDLDDSSGLHAMWGLAYVFNADGTGKSYMWEHGKVNDEYTYTYLWKRLGPNTIEIKLDEEDEGDVLEYTITTVNGPYGSELYKLTDSSYVADQYESEGFWNASGPLFKNKR